MLIRVNHSATLVVTQSTQYDEADLQEQPRVDDKNERDDPSDRKKK